MVFSFLRLLSAFVLIFLVALSAFLNIFESNALLLNFFFNTVVLDLMEYKFVWLLVGDTLCRICYYIGVVVVNTIIWKVLPEVHAQLPPPANAGVEPNTAVPAGPLQPAALQAQNIRLANVPDGTVEPRQQEAANDVLPERRPEYSEFMETLRLQQVAQEVAREEARARCRLEGAAHQQR